MSKKSKQDAWRVGLEVAASVTPILGPAIAILRMAAEDSEEVSKDGDYDAISEEARRQTLELRMAEMQAQVAQEIAIAQRIQDAHEVEIEEYYEGAGEGKLGLAADGDGVTAGLSGKGRKVTRRVFRFKGPPAGKAIIASEDQQE